MKKADIGKRLAAFFIDYLIYIVIFVPPFILFVPFDSFKEIFPIFMLILLISISLKDIFGGRSVGKRVFGLYVRKYDNFEKNPKIHKLIIRNLFLLIWPIEFIIIVIDKNSRRLGDKIANTQVVAKA